MRYLSLITFLTLFCPILLLGQGRGWAPGYVVTIQGDTFKGTIKYGNNILSDAKYDACHIVKFKTTRGIRINFTPQFTRCYKRGNDFYLTYKTLLAGQTWAVFIKKVASGPIDLYYYYGERKSFMYFLKKPFNNFLILQSDDTALTFNRKPIKAAVLSYFGDCPTVSKKIEDGTFRIYNLRLRDIPTMVDEYNKCKF
jgi:hypothetical protein